MSTRNDQPVSAASGGSRATGVGLASAIGRHSRAVLGVVLLITAALSYPMLFWPAEDTASQSPVTQITETQELVAERFADDVFTYFVLVEAKTGDVLQQAPLLSLLRNSANMREDPAFRDRLARLHDPSLGVDVHGIWSIADSVDLLLRQVGVVEGIAGATQEQIDGVVGAILEQSAPSVWGLATQTAQDEAGVWHSPAVFVTVAANNALLGGGSFLVTIGTDNLEKEQFARDLSSAIAGNGTYLSVWAPASDVNLTSNEQGELAGPFIGLTIAAVLLIVGLAFRSYWAVAVAGAALAVMMVWLRGGANLIGLKSDQILSTILPISMISFGIDSAFHGIGRVREETRRGLGGHRAFAIGLGSVFAALALAATSDAAAFLANTSAGIESVVQFGLAAALATMAAFLLLGITTPLLLSLTEGVIGARTITGFGRSFDLVLSLLASAMATGTVLVLVFVSAEIGLVMLAGYLLVMLALPLAIARRGNGVEFELHGSGNGPRRLGAAIASVAARPWLTIGVATIVTGVSLWGALQLEVTFDVEDFFSPDSDFVVALDKTAEYLGDRGGEPAVVYVETDLTSPEALDALQLFAVRVAATDNNPLARDANGAVRVDSGVLALVDYLDDDAAVSRPEDLSRMFDQALSTGVADTAGNAAWTPNDVGTILWRADDGGSYATVLTYQIPDTRDQANVVRTREILEPLASDLEQALVRIDPESRVVVTGSAIYRDDQLAGIRRSMLLALPIAVLACLVVAGAFMRSFRYALVSIVPILLVVTWLYGFMYQAGFAVNVVTSIIGAVSVGIGIDFSTHFTMRFLEERRSGAATLPAVAAAGTGTGSALAGSAVTSVAGFGILAFAPMPMFATYGLLTAIMIVLALVASLFVLPSLLVIVTGKSAGTSGRRVIDLSSGRMGALRIGMARDLSDGVVDHVLAAFESKLRDGLVLLRSAAGVDLAGLISSGEVDVGLMTRWPGASTPDLPGIEAMPLVREELVAVGGAVRDGDLSVSIETLARGLLVAGPHVESEVGLHCLLRSETNSPGLMQSVADVLTGLRLAAITGGAMVLPRSMAEVGSSLPIRSLDPPSAVETVLLASGDRSTDAEVFDLVVALNNALAVDKHMEVATGADL